MTKHEKEYRKMHKKLKHLCKNFKWFDYEYAVDIFAQCINMMRFAWENFELTQNKDDEINEYYENLKLMKEFRFYYLQYKNDTDLVLENRDWHNMWCLIMDFMRGWWD